ncbi:MAG: helix-turn-helix transcriptional regulator [Caulobacteraceae bacterium]|nr:helix-turn-helix transcriptional regulator [Caulobacteraceae bacterium]
MRSSASNPPAGAVIDDHAHEWHQLIYVSAGLIRVWTEAGSWVAPPTWAVWAPAGVRHGMRFVGASAFRTLYFRPDWWPDLPDECAAVTVSALLRALILRVTAQSALDRRVAVDTAIATVMLDEFRRSDAPPFTLPQPSSEPTRHAVALIAEGAPPSVTAGGLAQTVGLGVRTLERRFVAETGVTLGRWRRHRALLGALEQLAVGSPIKTVAASAGYSTSSAFVSAFRSLFGATPGRYFMLS